MFLRRIPFFPLFSIGLAWIFAFHAVRAQGADAPPVISIVKEGAKKDSVSLANLSAYGAYGQLFIQTLRRDLELSGWFKVASIGSGGTVSVNGTLSETSTGVQSNCKVTWAGKGFGWSRGSLGRTEVRKQAHQLADEMVKQIKREKGIAQSRIAFVNRRGSNKADLYVCDADGQGMLQITHDNVAIVGPRWAPNAKVIYYTSFIQGYPTILRHVVGGDRKTLASFKGLNTGAAASPDGTRVALILSYQGNPELYILNLASSSVTRMTTTPHGVEASPCWSPDGRSIVYVSDSSKTPQLYLLDIASRRSTRLTYKGTENVNPDWSEKGKIVYATRRGGTYQIGVMSPNGGDGSTEIIPTSGGNFEHPSWAPDSRHIVCSDRSALYILDTLGDPAVRLINIAGNWVSPDWSN